MVRQVNVKREGLCAPTALTAFHSHGSVNSNRQVPRQAGPEVKVSRVVVSEVERVPLVFRESRVLGAWVLRHVLESPFFGFVCFLFLGGHLIMDLFFNCHQSIAVQPHDLRVFNCSLVNPVPMCLDSGLALGLSLL